MTTTYQPLLDKHFAKGFAPDIFERAGIDQRVFDRCAKIVQSAYFESEEGQMLASHPGWGAGDLPAAFRRAFKGKRGLTVSKIEFKDYKDTKLNGQFHVSVEGDGWFSIIFIYAAFEFADRTNDDGSKQFADTFGEVLIRSAFQADDKAAYARMYRWWHTPDVATKLAA